MRSARFSVPVCSRPAATTSVGHIRPITTFGRWIELDVTPVVTGNGIYSLGIAGNGTSLAAYSSREGDDPPQLVVTLAG